MIGVLAPAFLWGGAALALAAVGLHLLARRPPARRPLPTARFLRPGARTRVRVEPRPRDVPLLLVRVAFALTVGAALAGVVATPAREGEGRVVLLDAGPGMEGSWTEARAAAREVLAGARDGDPDEAPATLLAYGFAGGPRVVDPVGLDGLSPGTVDASYEDGVRALASWVARDTRLASARATWVTRPRWSAWTPGFGSLRTALWPATLEVRAVEGGEAVARDGGVTPLRVALPPGPPAAPLRRAVEALGWTVAEGGAGAPATVVLAGDPGAAAMGELAARARAGATVVAWGDVPAAGSDALPWLAQAGGPDGVPRAAPGALALPGDAWLEADATPRGGTPAPGARVVVAWESGAPAAAARPLGDGCVVYAAFALDGPGLAALPDLPLLVRTLVTGCGEVPSGGSPGAGALAVMARGVAGEAGSPALPAAVDAASLPVAGGRSATRLLLALALLLLAADVGLGVRGPGGRWGAGGPVPGGPGGPVGPGGPAGRADRGARA